MPSMDSLVNGCVDVIALGLLAGASDPQAEELVVQTLLDQIDVLPLPISQRFAMRIQDHALQQCISVDPQDDDDEIAMWTPAEQSLWTSLIDRRWIVDLRIAALPQQLLIADVDWSKISLQHLDCSNLIHPTVSAQAASLIHDKLPLDALVTLHLSGWDDHVSDELLEMLASHCQRLQDVDISHCSKITDSGLTKLMDSNSATLKRLRANALRRLTGHPSVESIENCSRLHTLELDDCVSLECLPAFGTLLPSVTTLNLHGLSHFTDPQVTAALSGIFMRLRSLRLGESDLSGVSLKHLLSTSTASSTALREVDLSWCTHLESDAIAELVQRSPELCVLKLRCTKVDDGALAIVGSRSARLQVLDLERCDDLTSNGFDTLVASAQKSNAGFQRLEKINFSWTSVSERAMALLLMQSAETIRKVRVQGCKELRSTLLDTMLACDSRWPRLQLLDCSWINDIADDKLQAFADTVPRASVVGYYGIDVR